MPPTIPLSVNFYVSVLQEFHQKKIRTQYFHIKEIYQILNFNIFFLNDFEIFSDEKG